MVTICCAVLAVLLALFALPACWHTKLGPTRASPLGSAARRAIRRCAGREPWHAATAFARALLRNPLAVGACCPSSARRARAIAGAVDPANDGLAVELGGGSLVQYTYQMALGHARVPGCLELVAFDRVWINLPPARIEMYRHRD